MTAHLPKTGVEQYSLPFAAVTRIAKQRWYLHPSAALMLANIYTCLNRENESVHPFPAFEAVEAECFAEQCGTS